MTSGNGCQLDQADMENGGVGAQKPLTGWRRVAVEKGLLAILTLYFSTVMLVFSTLLLDWMSGGRWSAGMREILMRPWG